LSTTLGQASTVEIQINQLCDGAPAAKGEHTTITLVAQADALQVHVDAPYHGDPVPLHPPGPTPRLWEHEVVELFLFGTDAHYLELELGPGGHYLVLQLHGIRHIVARVDNLEFPRPRLHGKRWLGMATVPTSLLPDGLGHVNAHAIHGQATKRRYLSAFSGPGAPDFHRPEWARPLAPTLLAQLAVSVTSLHHQIK